MVQHAVSLIGNLRASMVFGVEDVLREQQRLCVCH